MDDTISGPELLLKCKEMLETAQKDQVQNCEIPEKVSFCIDLLLSFRSVLNQMIDRDCNGKNNYLVCDHIFAKIIDDGFGFYLSLRYCKYYACLSMLRSVYEKKFLLEYLESNRGRLKIINDLAINKEWVTLEKELKTIFQKAKKTATSKTEEKRLYEYLNNYIVHPHCFDNVFNFGYDKILEGRVLQLFFDCFIDSALSHYKITQGSHSEDELNVMENHLKAYKENIRLDNNYLQREKILDEVRTRQETTSQNGTELNNILIESYMIEVSLQKYMDAANKRDDRQSGIQVLLLNRLIEYTRTIYLLTKYMCYAQATSLIRNIQEIHFVFIALRSMPRDEINKLNELARLAIKEGLTGEELINKLSTIRKQGRETLSKRDVEHTTYYNHLSDFYMHPKRIDTDYSFEYEQEAELYIIKPLSYYPKETLRIFFEDKIDYKNDPELSRILSQIIRFE